jgi:hypothetical protein
VSGGGAGPSIPDLGSGGSDVTGAAGQGNSAASDLTSATQKFGTTSGSTSSNWAWGGGYVYANAPLSGHAFYFCNEKSYSGILGFLSYAIDQVRSIVPNNLLYLRRDNTPCSTFFSSQPVASNASSPSTPRRLAAVGAWLASSPSA